ncbi:MAG: prepilin-type N-terminal cleavage/methylation domain-containing protein [Phycisphaerales bacterium]|nr:prepilin-type N-terminal cleavage/methylation domain-containing protein [Phycisphaerales bacterium]
MPRRAGYTLLELILVIGLLGLAAALLVPHVVGLSRMETQSAVRRLISDISYAQSDALANQAYRRVQFLDEGRGYALLSVDEVTFALPFDPETATYLEDPSGTYQSFGRYVVDYVDDDRYAGVSLGSIETAGAGNWITFDPLGGTVSSVGTAAGSSRIVVEGTDQSFEVLVTPMTGKLTVQKIDG